MTYNHNDQPDTWLPAEKVSNLNITYRYNNCVTKLTDQILHIRFKVQTMITVG